VERSGPELLLIEEEVFRKGFEVDRWRGKLG